MSASLQESPFFRFPRRERKEVEVQRHDIGEIKVMGIRQYLIKHYGLPLTYAYATLRQSVAGNSTFRGIVCCNLGTPKTVISNFVTMQQIETPYLSPYGYPNNVPGGQKTVGHEKSLEETKKSSSKMY